MDNGSGAIDGNEGNLGPDDSYGFDESDENWLIFQCVKIWIFKPLWDETSLDYGCRSRYLT